MKKLYSIAAIFLFNLAHASQPQEKILVCATDWPFLTINQMCSSINSLPKDAHQRHHNASLLCALSAFPREVTELIILKMMNNNAIACELMTSQPIVVAFKNYQAATATCTQNNIENVENYFALSKPKQQILSCIHKQPFIIQETLQEYLQDDEIKSFLTNSSINVISANDYNMIQNLTLDKKQIALIAAVATVAAVIKGEPITMFIIGIPLAITVLTIISTISKWGSQKVLIKLKTRQHKLQ